ncbi:retrotransposon protein, putative, ty1-copia subclass [Tanacetum coccineum]
MFWLREVMQDRQIEESMLSGLHDNPENAGQKKMQEEEDLSELAHYEADIKLNKMLIQNPDVNKIDINNVFDLLKYNQKEVDDIKEELMKKDKKEPDSQIQIHDLLAFVQGGIRLERPDMGKEVAIGDPKCYKYEHDFLVDSDNEGEQLEANVVFMSRLEKMKSFEVEHAHDAKTSGCDSLTDEALINHVYYATNNDSESDQDKLIHGTTIIFFHMVNVDTSSLDPTCDNSQVCHENSIPCGSLFREKYEDTMIRIGTPPITICGEWATMAFSRKPSEVLMVPIWGGLQSRENSDFTCLHMTTSVGNNSVFRSFFEKQKLTGPNFIDWYRQLRLDLAAHAAWVKGQREVVVLMLLTMDLDIQRNLAPFLAAYGMASGTISLCFSKQLKGNYLQTVREFHTCMQEEGHRLAPFLKIEGPTLTIWERLGQPVGQNLAVSLILVSLNKDFTSFVQNFNMHGMGKTVNELHAMLKLHEESLPKKTSPPPMKDNPARTPSVYQMCVKLGMEEGNTVRGSHRVDEKRSYSGRLAFSIFTKTLSFPSNLGYMTMVVENVLCLSGKMARKPYSHQVERAKDLLGLIHTDVCGPFRIVSRQGASYFVTFTDDFSRYGYVYLLKHKHEVFETFKVFQKEVENQLGKTIKSLRSDRGGEYMSQEFLDHLKEHGIIAHRTPPYTPQNNGVIPKGNNGIFFLLPSENKVFVARNAEFFESKLLDLKASGSVEDLEEIQEEDTNPSVDTSLNHEEDDQEIDEPQSDINPIRRSTRTRRPTDRLCLYIDTEEHELGDLGEPANYRAAYGSWNPRNGLMR